MIFDISKLIRFFPEEEQCLFLPAGEVLFHQGTTGHHMYVVKYGEVEIRVNDRFVGKGMVGNPLGEESLLEQAPRMASITAITDCKLIEIDQARLNSLASSNPVILNQLSKLTAQHRAAWAT